MEQAQADVADAQAALNADQANPDLQQALADANAALQLLQPAQPAPIGGNADGGQNQQPAPVVAGAAPQQPAPAPVVAAQPPQVAQNVLQHQQMLQQVQGAIQNWQAVHVPPVQFQAVPPAAPANPWAGGIGQPVPDIQAAMAAFNQALNPLGIPPFAGQGGVGHFPQAVPVGGPAFPGAVPQQPGGVPAPGAAPQQQPGQGQQAGGIPLQPAGQQQQQQQQPGAQPPPAGAAQQMNPQVQAMLAALQALNLNQQPAEQKSRIPQFSSTDANKFQNHLEQFMTMSVSRRWTDQQKKSNMMDSFTGEAAGLVSQLAPMIVNPACTYAHLQTMLLTIFVPDAGSSLSRDEWADSRQKTDESISVWHSRCQMLFRRAFPTMNINEPLAREHFSKFLLNKSYHGFIMGKDPQTYAQCLTFANQAHSVHRTMARAGADTGINAMQPQQRKRAPNDRSNRPPYHQNGGPAKPHNPYDKKQRSSTCSWCDKPGHYMSKCPEFKQLRDKMRTLGDRNPNRNARQQGRFRGNEPKRVAAMKAAQEGNPDQYENDFLGMTYDDGANGNESAPEDDVDYEGLEAMNDDAINALSNYEDASGTDPFLYSRRD